MLAVPMTQVPTYTLFELLESISGTLADVYEGSFWITTELAAVHAKSKGYWVLELQESNERGQKLAQTQAFVWTNNASRVIYRFQKETGQKLAAGMQVKIRVQVGFLPQWGFRLTVDDIDSSFSLGQAQATIEKIRKDLQDQGVWEKNKMLPTPKDFFHIAIVAPDTSAGLEDFLREANVLQQSGLMQYEVFNAPFEGPNAASGITGVMQRIHQGDTVYDAVCVVRGGGAAAGIAWLNQQDIVRAICLCPYPVLSGIGHERDQTLVDEVANVACGTPSKTIQYITSSIINQAQAAQQHWVQFQHDVAQSLLLARQKVDEQHATVQHVVQTLLDRARTDIEHLLRQALHLGPQATLERGYTVVQDASGRPLTSAVQAQEQPSLTIRFQDGQVHAAPLSSAPQD